MSGFKLIAIIPLGGCNQRFLNNLVIGEIYQFYQNYSIELDTEKSKIETIKENQKEDDFYSLEHHRRLNISAIVGKNGSGKSSLIELFFLVIYKLGTDKTVDNDNLIYPESSRLQSRITELSIIKEQFSEYLTSNSQDKKSILEAFDFPSESIYYAWILDLYNIQIENYRFLSSDDLENRILDSLNKIHLNLIDHLKWENDFDTAINKDLNVSIVFQISDDENVDKTGLYDLTIKDGIFSFTSWDDNSENKSDVNDIDLTRLFYTIAVNYSHHSLNSKNIGSWLDRIFHKNDGYKTPLVVNPMRDSGNFNINKEELFARSRLLSNLMASYLKGEDLTEFLLNKNLRPTLLKFHLKNNIRDGIKYGWKTFEEGVHFEKIIFDKFIVEGIGITLDGVKKTPFAQEVVSYIINKFYKITETYDGYSSVSNPIRTFDIPYYVDEIYDKFMQDNSHVVFKLKQALNFLSSGRNVEFQKLEHNENEFLFTLDELKKWCALDSNASFNTIIEYLPPSIFDIEFIFNESDKMNSENAASFSALSSGEKQLIHSIQTVIYHLNNLDSIEGEDRIAYSSINVIFDEIELYFHPELQRKFIDHLIKNINRLSLTNIRNINVCFATHSPFILSDITNQNILRLENGKVSSKEFKQTFGANIHDLLANDFFLQEGFMGEFAKEKINQVINSLRFVILTNRLNLLDSEKSKSRDSHAEIESIYSELQMLSKTNLLTQVQCEQIIPLVGEPVLHFSLMEMYGEAFNQDKNRFIDDEIDRLKRLKS